MKSNEFSQSKLQNAIVEDVLKGTLFMREMGRKHLPKFDIETDEDYFKRLNRATLTPILQETIETVTGRIFSNDVIVDSPLPLDSVNEFNDSFQVVLKAVVNDAVKFGCSYLFVNYVNGLPQFEHIPYESILKLETDGVSLTSITYRKAEKEITIGRGFVTIEKEKFQIIKTGKVLDACPVVPFVIKPITPFLGVSPYAELATLCVKLWQADSAQDNIVSYLRQPILTASGVNDIDSVDVGANMLLIPKDAEIKYIEHSGNAVEIGFTHIDRIKQDCLLAGASISSLSKIAMTDEQANEEKIKTTSRVLAWCEVLEDCAAKALQLAADYVGIKDGGKISLRENILNEKNKVELTDLLNLFEKGIIQIDEVRSFLKERKVIDK